MEKAEDRTQLSQLITYSILSQLVNQRNILDRLEESLGVKERRGLEGKIKELEEENLSLRTSLDSLSKIKSTQEEENKTLREKKKLFEKQLKKLEEELAELRSEKNLLKAKQENKSVISDS